MIRNLHEALFANDDILSSDEDAGNVTFPSDEIGILSVDPSNAKLDDANLMKMILRLLFMSAFWCDKINLKKAKHLKKM